MERISSRPGAIILSDAENYKLAQSLYNIITAKTEKKYKPYSGNYCITEDSLAQLVNKIEQMLTQWKILGKSCKIIINHTDDGSEDFSSFERFKLYDKSNSSAIQQIILQYDFLLCPEGYDEYNKNYLQNYTVTVYINNKAAVYDNSNIFFPRKMMRFFSQDNINLEVEYVDYIILRNIVSTVDSWESSLEKNDNPSILTFFQKHSDNYSRILKIVFFVVISVLMLRNLPFIQIINFMDLARFGLLTSLYLFLFMNFGYYVGDFIESNIDALSEISYIKINKGDEIAIKKYKNKFIRKIVKIMMTIIGTIIIGLFSEKLMLFVNGLFK